MHLSKQFVRLIVLVGAIILGGKALAVEPTASPASPAALPFPTKVFDAEYRAIDDGERVRVASNGTGKVLMTSDQNKVRSIFDFNEKAKFNVVDDDKTVSKKPLTEVPEIINDAHTLKTSTMKEVGAKKVEGHDCHGYNLSKGFASLTIWLADDIGIIVKEEVDLTVPSMPTKHFDLVLNKWTATAPSDKELVIPADYKQVVDKD